MKYHSATHQIMKSRCLPILLLLAFLPIASIRAQQMPDPMSPPRLVNDFAGFLTNGETAQLEEQLLGFNNETSTQIYIITVSDLDGYDPADYSTRIAEKWGIGQQGKDNGILILVKPKTAESRGEVFISVGYGLEAVVPDAVANRVIDQEILPHFRENSAFNGLNAATATLMALTRGEFTADQYMQHNATPPGAAVGGIIFFIIIMAVLFAGRSKAGRHNSIGREIPFWILMGMLSSGRSNAGMFGNFSSGRGGFGGGGFGGFGGGGGGSFGGGGAGGSW